MATLKEQWIQEIMENLKLPPLSPAMCKTLLPVIEMHMKKIAQQAHKFQRRSKSPSLSVEDVNLSLSLHKIEPVYGFSISESVSQTSNSPNSIISFAEMVKNNSLPGCPLKPEISLHWLAVNGHQPLIAENPSVISAEAEELPHSLPKEMQHLYARLTGIILTASDGSGISASLRTVYSVLERDAGLRELMPYLSRFFYQQIKTNTRRLPLLFAIVRCVRSLLRNPAVSLESHLQQLLPVLFTCIVAPRLSTSPAEDHWALRNTAADIISLISSRFSEGFMDLQARVLKTYVSALGDDKALSTLYGGIVGLTALGPAVVRTLLVGEHLLKIHNRLLVFGCCRGRVDTAIKPEFKTDGKNSRSNGDGGVNSKRVKVEHGVSSGAAQQQSTGAESASSVAENTLHVDMCKAALLKALGCYMVSSMRLPTSSAVLSLVRRSQPGGRGTRVAAGRLLCAELPLCNLEEALVPYYAAASLQDYHCRLFI